MWSCRMQLASDNINVSDVVYNIMRERILFTKDNGEKETPSDAFFRVAQHVAKGHAVYESEPEVNNFIELAADMMYEHKFMPNTPTLVNAGFQKAQCSACFVLPVEDNLQSIYKAHHDQGLIQASGGGTGFYLGGVRAAGSSAANRFTTKGPINWLKMLNENAGHVAQGMREGANMAILDVRHPDVMDFITCKKAGYDIIIEDLATQLGVSLDEAKRIKAVIGIEKFNISISISDKFMESLSNGDDWCFCDPHTKIESKPIPAIEIWELIVSNAYENGEPGIVFPDTANKNHSIPHIGRLEATNPCGEQWLLPYESCTLGHVNLSKFVIGINGTSEINWADFEDTIRFGTQFLDAVVEVNQFPIPELAEMNRNTRRIGLGVMGWADMLAMMGIPYDSDEALAKADQIGEFFDGISLDESRRLGKNRGNFGFFEGSVFDGVEKYMRNSDRTTVAPTGSGSMYAMCSSSIEPLFSPVTVREQAGMVQVDYHPALFHMLGDNNLDTPEIREKISKLNGSIKHADFLPDNIRLVFPTAHEISYDYHIKHQAIWQKHITSAVSKTVNMPNNASMQDVDTAYKLAYKSGCKGITIYRDGTRKYQPLSHSKKESNQKSLIQIGKRSDVTHGSNRKIPNGCGNLMVYIGGDESNGENSGIHEITARLGKGGGCASAQTEAIARMASIAMQHGASPEKIAKQLGGIRCQTTAMYNSKHTGDRPRIVTSCADAISIALSEHIADLKGDKVIDDNTNNHIGACVSCGSVMAFEEGCSKCYNCGYSRC